MTYQSLPIDAMLSTACNAARDAGRHAIRSAGTARVSIKAGKELVTDVDVACQQIIVEGLTTAFPGHGLLAEEGPAGAMLKVPPCGGQEVWWAIDPIDGTQNFSKGIPIFAVSIAAMYRGRPVVAAVYYPSVDVMFTAAINGPAMCSGEPIHTTDEPLGPLVSVGIDSHLGDSLPPWVEPLIVGTRHRNLGSAALHLAYVGKGAMVGVVLCMTKLWDIAAGALIAQQAGAIVSNWKGNPIWPLDMDNYQGQAIQCLAANPVAHRQILPLLDP